VTDLPQLALRTLTEDDLDQVIDLIDLVFSDPPSSSEVRAFERDVQELAGGRGVGVFDTTASPEELAGMGSLGRMRITVPGGGTLPLAAVLFVGVSPVYRRRGVMTTVMRHHLHTLHEAGAEPLAGLTASESVIYGRFGFGIAAFSSRFTIPRERSALRPVAGVDDVTLRLVPTAGSIEACEAVYARYASRRAGALARPEHWARLYAADPEQWREGRSILRTVLAERGGEVAGFARYHAKNETSPAGLPAGFTDVGEVYGDDAAVLAALVRYLTSIDLIATTKIWRQPADSPIGLLLADFRAADLRVRDSLHLRLVDVDRALAGRTYSAPVNVVLEVADAFCPWNAGRWQLTGDEKTARCVRTDAPADLALDVRDLAAAYLGGSTLAALAQASLVTELRPGALTDASRAFATDLAPHLPWGI
jgi:predicted acetyltransferase